MKRLGVVVVVLVALAVAILAALGLRRWKEARAAALAPPVVLETESRVDPSLAWLARHQSGDGRWSATRFLEHCRGPKPCTGAGVAEDDVTVTALATLAFLGAGYTPQNRASYVDKHTGETVRFGETVRHAMRFLLAHQESSGLVTDGPPRIHRHALATLALCEAFGITNAVAYRAPAQNAIAYLDSARSAAGVWGATPGATVVDEIATGEAALAWKSAAISGLAVSDETQAAIVSWTYVPSARGGPLPTETAYRLVGRIFSERRKTPALDTLAAELVANPPSWDQRAFEHWQIATHALFQFDGPSGRRWKSWNKAVASTLCEHQALARDGCEEGSWDGPRGRLYSTAQAALTLEVYYRYASVFGSEKR